MSELPSTFSTLAADGPQNSNATDVPSHYEICDRTGFKLPRGTLKREWNGVMVRPQSWEPRHLQDFVRSTPDAQKGSPRPEQTDVFIQDNDQVAVSDL